MIGKAVRTQEQRKKRPGRRTAIAVAACLALSSCSSVIPNRLGRIPEEDIAYCDMCNLQEVVDSRRVVFERLGTVTDVQIDHEMRTQSGIFRFRITDRDTFLSVLQRSYELPSDISMATSIVVLARVSQPMQCGQGIIYDGRELGLVPLGAERPNVVITYTVGGELRQIELEIGSCLNDLFFGAGEYRGRAARVEREGSGDPSGYCERY